MALLERLSSLGHGHRHDAGSPIAHSQSDDAAAYNRKQYVSPWEQGQTVTGPAYDSGAYDVAGITWGNGGECLSEVGLADSMASPQLRRPRADSGLPAASDDDCAHDYDMASVLTYDDGAVTDDSAIEDMHTPQDRDSGLYDEDNEHDYDPASCRTYDRADAADEPEGGGEAVENNGSAQPPLPPQPIPRSRTSFDEHDYDLGSSKTYADDEADDKVGVWEVGVRDAAEAAVADEDIVAQLLGLPQPLPQPRTSFDEHDYDLGSTKTYADDEADGEVSVRDAAEAAVADEDIVAQLPQPLPQPRTSFDEHDYDLGSTKTYADDEADGEAVKDGGDSIEDDGAQQAELPGPSQPGVARRRITVWFDEHDYDIASTKTYADDGQDGAAADIVNAPGVGAAVAAVSAAMQQAERGAIPPSAGQGHHDAGPVVLRRRSDDALKGTGTRFAGGRKLATSRRGKKLRRRESAPAGMRGLSEAAETAKMLTQSRPFTVHETIPGSPSIEACGDMFDSATMTSTGSNVTLTRTDSTTTITPTLRSQSEPVPVPEWAPDRLWPCTAMLPAAPPSTSGPESAPVLPPTRRNSMCSIASTRLPTPPAPPSMSAPVSPPTRRSSLCSIASTRLPIGSPMPGAAGVHSTIGRSKSLSPGSKSDTISRGQSDDGDRRIGIQVWQPKMGPPPPPPSGPAPPTPGVDEGPIPIRPWQSPKMAHQAHFSATAPSPKRTPPPLPRTAPPPLPQTAPPMAPTPLYQNLPERFHSEPEHDYEVPATAATEAVWTPSDTGPPLRSGSCPATTAASLEQFGFVRRRGLRRIQRRSSDGMVSVGAGAAALPSTGKDRPRSASVPSLGETLTAWMGQRPLPPTPPTPPIRPSLDDSVALPDGWGTAETPKGETFYIHHLTQIISWVHPTKQQATLFLDGTDL